MTLEELKKTLSQASQVFILTDENVAMFWLPETKHWLGCDHALEIVLKPGEKYKTMQTAQRIWKTLMKHHADRQAVMVNLGGGVITDLGGFVASCYHRGIRFLNIPTTLLAMVDAAIGGKTGVDFGGCKKRHMTLKIAIPENLDYQGVFEPVLNRYTTFHKLRRVKTTNFGTLFELIYSVDVLENIDQKKFVDELRALNGNMTINLVFFKYDDKIYEN